MVWDASCCLKATSLSAFCFRCARSNRAPFCVDGQFGTLLGAGVGCRGFQLGSRATRVDAIGKLGCTAPVLARGSTSFVAALSIGTIWCAACNHEMEIEEHSASKECGIETNLEDLKMRLSVNRLRTRLSFQWKARCLTTWFQRPSQRNTDWHQDKGRGVPLS